MACSSIATQEIAGTMPLPLTMTPSEQIVDIAGDTAVMHGVNTLTDAAGVLERERFTDVFVLQNGTWMALSAQETHARLASPANLPQT